MLKWRYFPEGEREKKERERVRVSEREREKLKKDGWCCGIENNGKRLAEKNGMRSGDWQRAERGFKIYFCKSISILTKNRRKDVNS